MTQYSRSNSKLQIFVFNIQPLGTVTGKALYSVKAVLRLSKGKVLNIVGVLKQ
jgi:hypothetical protein